MPKESGELEKYVADLSKAVQEFSEHDAGSRQALERLCASDPLRFFAAGIRVVATLEPSAGSRCLVLLLANDKRLTNWLLDTKACTLKASTTVARATADAGVQLQAAFEMALNKALQQQASPANTDRILRLLNLMEAIGNPNCWSSFQVELMAYPEKVVRSKAALLIGRTQKNTDWIVRRLLDRDPRVQANAVETLWGLDAAEAKPHLIEALKSKHNRVFANAALGLYRLGEAAAIHALLEATQHEDPRFRISALWAIGQTQDPRFLPALSLQFKSAQGKLKLILGGAISRIRQRERSGGQANALQIEIPQAVLEAGDKRRLKLTVSSHPAKNLSSLKATEFLVWENGAPVEDYQVRLAAPSEVILAGLVAPWPESPDDPFEKALRDGLDRCLLMKRKDDLWRIDRYAAAEAGIAAEGTGSPDGLPYGDIALAPQHKAAGCWISEPDQVRKILPLAVPRACAAVPLAAVERQVKSMGHPHGRRHVFVLLHGPAASDLNQQPAVETLRGLTKDHRLILHGIAAGDTGQWRLVRELCLSRPDGSFVELDRAAISEGLAKEYAKLCNRFEINYSLRSPAESGAAKPMVKLKIESDRGNGQAEVTLELPPEQPALESPAVANAPAS